MTPVVARAPGRARAPRRRRRKLIAGHERRTPVIPILVLACFVLTGILGPYLAPYNPDATSLTERLAAPSSRHWFGTDALGRDILSRLIYGDRVTLEIATAGLAIGAAVGIGLGVVAGLRRGWVDVVLGRLMDIALAFPPVFFGLLFAATRGPGIWSVVIAIALVTWAQFARVIRSEVISLSEKGFMALARVHGASQLRTTFAHILPNIAPTCVVLISLRVGFVVILDSIFSYLGAGVAPPAASWGGMISDGQAYISTAWWIALAPGLAILAVVLSLNLTGDWLRVRLDPTLRGSDLKRQMRSGQAIWRLVWPSRSELSAAEPQTDGNLDGQR